MPSASDIKAGGAFVELYTENGPLYAGLKEAQDYLANWGREVTSMGARIMAVGGGMLAPFFLSIKSASGMEETMNKFNVVFGESAERVKAWGDQYAESVDRSKRQTADFPAGSQDLFVPMGFAAEAAEAMSKQVTKLAVDLASFNNKKDPEVLRDLHAALTGSGEVMKKYGVILSEAAVKQELLNQGMDPKTASEQAKAQARLAIILRGTKAAHGDAIRSAGSFANQMKRFWATIDDDAVKIGSVLLPVVTPLIKAAGDVAKFVGYLISENKDLVVTVAAAAAVVFLLGGGITALGLAATVAATAPGGLATVLGFIMSPTGLLLAGLTGVVGYLIYTGDVVDWLKEHFGFLFEDAQAGFNAIKNAMKAGDFKAATEVIWAGVQLEWIRGINELKATWRGFQIFFMEEWSDTLCDFVALFNRVLMIIQTPMQKLSSRFEKVWTILEAGAGKGPFGKATEIQMTGMRAVRKFTATAARGVGVGASPETLEELKKAAREMLGTKISRAERDDQAALAKAIQDYKEARLSAHMAGKLREAEDAEKPPPGLPTPDALGKAADRMAKTQTIISKEGYQTVYGRDTVAEEKQIQKDQLTMLEGIAADVAALMMGFPVITAGRFPKGR